ncbi:hypothetical protein PBCVNEJV1_876L [Paramecium bursaria Chlorella virus NE-JV-1]|nr:hypothetical protein PBCVNEJV1_876L [Paramecium bursaria Chlorella virus NE-JV-1]
MRKLPHSAIVLFAAAGLVLGIFTGRINRYLNVAIHRKFPKDGPLVTGSSLVIQFAIMIGVLMLAATHLPYINVDDLGGGIVSFGFINLYFAGQIHLVSEIAKFVDDRFDGLERYV